MKASEIIKWLAEIIKEKGDLKTNIESIETAITRQFDFEEAIFLTEEP